MDKGKIIDFCSNKGRRFIGCFHELYLCPEKENTIIPEMENLYDAVKGVKIDGKPLLKSYLHDWFFTAGSYYEDAMEHPEYGEIVSYDNLIFKILDDMPVREALKYITTKEK